MNKLLMFKRTTVGRILVLIVAILADWSAISGQSLNDNIVPPSPKAQEILHFGDYPVSLHTGVPQITIPLYTIQLKDFSLPLTLDYNASGIKVEQESGETGLGWTLQAGGVITHTIRGYYDFADEYYFTRNGDSMEDLTGIYHLDKTTLSSYYDEPPFTLPSGMSKVELFRRLNNECLDYGSVDFNPDLFQYNFCGYSGKFIFNHRQDIVKEKEDNIRIQPIRNPQKRGVNYLSSWILTTPDGTKYFFEQTEQSVNTGLSERYGGRFNCSYYLTRIVTADNTQIHFSYSKLDNMIGTFQRIESDRLEHDISVHYYNYEQVRLDKISFPNGEICFSYSSDRDDLSYGQKLTAMSVLQNGVTVSHWIFEYGYFVANRCSYDMPTLDRLNSMIHSNNFTDSWNKKRLRLERIEQVAGSQTQPYAFSYEEQNLPTKLSASQDHWGYFNDAPNRTMVPSFCKKVTTTNGGVKVFKYGLYGNRTPLSSSGQAFLLKSVTYPTGGKSTYSYEPNDYRTDVLENDTYKRDLYYRIQERSIVEGGHAHNIGEDWKDTANIVLYSTENVSKTRIQVFINVELDDSYNYAKYERKKMYFRIYKKGDEGCVPWSFILASPYTPSIVDNETRYIQKSWSDIEADSGTYSMEVYGPLRAYIRKLEFKVCSICPPEEYMRNHPVEIGGGVRIKEIRSYDLDGKMLSGVQYLYTKGGVPNNNETTGKLMEYPRYHYLSGNTLSVYSDGLRNKGYSVGYSEVTAVDLNKNGQSIGKTSYYYSNHPDLHLCYSGDTIGSAHDGSGYSEKDINAIGLEPYTIPNNGNLLRKELYEFQDGCNKLLRRFQYRYSAIGEGPYTYWGIRRNITHEEPCADDATYLNYVSSIQNFTNNQKKICGFIYPALIPYTSMLSEEVITDYYETDSVVTDIKYNYNSRHQLSRKSVSCGPDNDVTEYIYPLDKEDDIVMEALVDSNRIDTPVQITHARGSSREQTVSFYDLFNQVPRISSIKTNTGQGKILETRSQCLRYDSHGNMIEIVGDDGCHIIYLWGYCYQYPIAEIRNATYSSVRSALGMDPEILGGSTSPNMDAVNNLRVKMPFAQVTTYTYQPLFGITSVTLPSGQRTSYEYDLFGRLYRVKNHFGEIVEQYNYNYKNGQ